MTAPSEDRKSKKKSGFRFSVPHTYVLLMMLILIAGICTYLIPAGTYERIIVDGREVIDPASYQTVAQNPLGLFDLLQAVPAGLMEVANIIFFVLCTGGAIYIVQQSGAIDAGLYLLVKKMKNKGPVLLVFVSLFFALGGAIYGMAEEILAFVPVLVILCISLGYDSLVAVAVAFATAAAGFAGAFMNPFTIGVAQGIAELPLYSGLGLRIVSFVVLEVVTLAYILHYCQKLKADPTRSAMYEFDQKRSIDLNLDAEVTFTNTHKLVLLIFLGTFCLMVFGVFKWGWYIKELTALFVGMAILAGLVGRQSPNTIAENFIEGASGYIYAGIVTGLARGILVVLSEGNVIDTILYHAAQLLTTLPSSVIALGMYVFQCLLNFIVPSGSGQAALSMPIMAPLADLSGVTRQTAVLCFQFGDAISNVLTPTSGYFMAGLALAKVPWIKWVKWAWPLLVMLYLVCGVFVIIAQSIHYGPY